MLSKYETVLIVKPDLPEDQFEVVKSRAITAITSKGGHEIVFQDWGKKRLAYPIKKSPKGNYLYFRYLAGGEGVAELERNLNVLDPLLRFLTVKLADRVDAEAFDFDGERETIFPFGVKPREPVVETPAETPAEKTGDEAKAEAPEKSEADGEAKAEPEAKPAPEAAVEAAVEVVEEKAAEEKAEVKAEEKAEEKVEKKPAKKAKKKAEVAVETK